MRRVRMMAMIAVAAVMATVVSWSGERPAAQERGPMPVPLRFSAWAINMGNWGTGRNNVVDLRVERWSTLDEREKLLATMVDKGVNEMFKTMVRMPVVGRMRVPGWQGPDPHKMALGWDLHYAWNEPLPEGGNRIILATDRYITFYEAANNPRVSDYPFTLIELRLDRNGEGTGKASVATKIVYDKEKKTLVLENYGTEPVRLEQVKIEK